MIVLHKEWERRPIRFNDPLELFAVVCLRHGKLTSRRGADFLQALHRDPNDALHVRNGELLQDGSRYLPVVFLLCIL